MSKQSTSSNNPPAWLVQVPLSDLMQLQALPGQISKFQSDIVRLENELAALRLMLCEVMQQLGDLKRQARK